MSEPEGRLIAIGDVHGCVHALDAVLEGIRPTHADHLVFLGDVIDQGRDTRDVLERLITLRSMCQLTLIQGNHEEMMFAARTSIEALRYWEVCGGLATLTSYRYGAKLTDVPDEHWQFLSENVPYLETEAFIFTHANYLPELPMSEQPEHQLRWPCSTRVRPSRIVRASRWWSVTLSSATERCWTSALSRASTPLVAAMAG